jgi:thioredoxin-like negative regulator of GroEL
MELNDQHTYAACLNCQAINKIFHKDVPLAVCHKCQSVIKFKKLISECTETNLRELVQTSDLEVLAYFSVPLCMSCKMISSQFEMASIENLNTVFIKLNLGSGDPFAEFMEIKAFPCLILFKDGVEERRHYGVLNSQSIGKFITSPLDGE